MYVLILGATSDMARPLFHRHAARGDKLYLAARKGTERLSADVADLRIRYQVEAQAFDFDAREMDEHAGFYAQIDPKPDVVYVFFGYLADQHAAQNDWKTARQSLDVNFTGAASILHHVANDFERRRRGTIVGISSVAGERGRGDNYYYGAAKAGLTQFLAGLRARLYPHGVHVLTVKPGFVRTAMTENMELPPALTASPEKVARDILRAVDKKRNVIYIKSLWRPIMFILRHVPEPIFKRMKLR